MRVQGLKRFGGRVAAICFLTTDKTKYRISRTTGDRARTLGYHSLMRRRLVILLLMIAVLFQGPALSYAATLESADGNPVSHSVPVNCGALMAAGVKPCDLCCSHGSMLSCASTCLSFLDSPGPLATAVMLRIPARGARLPEAGAAPFVDHHPPHRLRPPIASRL